MIALRQVTFARAGRPLVIDASVQLHPGWKVGVVGANGCGKSSLFALLANELHAESGNVEIPASWHIARVAQETPALPDSALDFVLDGDVELRRIERELVEAETKGDGVAIGHLHARYGEIGGYSAKARVAEVLHGLGFTDADFARSVSEFSGGWRVRLNLARALSCRADLLLLDEPTNHLDLDAVFWLENWLKNTPATLLLISHDRDFLDAVVGQIIAIDLQRLTLTSGGYSDYERARAARLATQQSSYEAQQREIAHLSSFIERFKAKATKARQAQSRIKTLERMEMVAAAHVDSPFHFAFRQPTALPDPLLTIEKASAGYADHKIIDHVTMTLRPGCRIGLLGRNGAGKSTLIKLLANSIPQQGGERKEAKALNIGYFAQHQLEQLRPDESPLQHLVRLDPTATEQELRDYIGGFDFRGDMATRAIEPFSGGEKSRLALALMIRPKPNLLLLDEPTNHLDLEMREALTFALQDFEGGVVFVSHDRHLLRTCADELLLVADGKVSEFEGDLDDYASWLAAQRSAEKAQEPDVLAEKTERLAQRADAKANRQALLAQRRPLVKEIEQLERKLAKWNEEKAALDTQFADPDFYATVDRAKSEEMHKQAGLLGEQIDEAEMRWLEVHEALEALPSAD
ncbi:ATP-binding cassette domain-containing protein [Ferribacterium limneticum]|uniref:ATP-binding cassette domain-containing protein n=1 Tax=Ferribacterium limneticum TaxID=76259 RepID=UPI001CFB5781|nr:ATP-binding cassette domain-containing protein [Ferribacterium limneticum]UCV28600.1 ATP-binding cassette domain-containing protein [Ferribacterium limneticum]UCV32517.1 ATP-binding cassette domain-containing protein [Ferribacterium limneticum]